MDLFTEDKIISGFKKNDHSFLAELYTLYYPIMERFVVCNRGTTDDTKDIFQEALLVVYLKVQNNEFELNCTFLTYLYAVVKNLWLKELRIKRTNGFVVKDVKEIEDVELYINFEKEYDFNVEYFLFRKYFNRLGKACREILKLFFEKNSYQQVADLLRFDSPEVVRKRKYRCKETLIRSIKKDPMFQKTLKNE